MPVEQPVLDTNYKNLKMTEEERDKMKLNELGRKNFPRQNS